MTKIALPMKLKIKEIVLIEQRPFCIADFREFEVGGKKYHMNDGTFRNYILKLRKPGEIEVAFKSKPVFYTIPGKKFTKSMTLDHMGVSTIINDSLLKRELYKQDKKIREIAERTHMGFRDIGAIIRKVKAEVERKAGHTDEEEINDNEHKSKQSQAFNRRLSSSSFMSYRYC
jgi:hypothetical protein